MFKSYRKMNGKLYGPYYYKNIRVDGKVKTIYLGKNKREALKKEKLIAKQFSRTNLKNETVSVKQKNTKSARNSFGIPKFFGIIFLILIAAFFGFQFSGFLVGEPIATGIILPSAIVTFSGGNVTEDGDIFYDGTYTKQNTITTATISADNRPYFEFNISAIPDTATIDSVVLNLTINTAIASDTCSIYEMGAQPNASTAQTVWNDAGNGTAYVSASTKCRSTNWQSWDLGSSAISKLSAQLTSDWFAVGFTSSGGDTGIFNTSESATKPQLIVVYNRPPQISIISPLNQTYNISVIDFNVSLNENTSWCGFSLDNAANVTMTKFNDTYFNYTKTGLTYGSHNITFSCNDTAGYMNTTSYLYFLVNVFPSVFLNLPENNNNTVNLDSDIIFNCSVTDDGGLSNTTLYTNLNGTWQAYQTINMTGTSNSTTFIVNYNNFTNYSIVDNSSKWNCYAYDIESQGSWNNTNFTFSGWNLGSFSNTSYNTSLKAVTLTGNSSGQYPNTTGVYASSIKDAGFIADWRNMSWYKGLIYGRQLPNYQYDEKAAGTPESANMTGNVLLFHFDNDLTVGESYVGNGSKIFDFSGRGNNGTWICGITCIYNLSGGKLGGAFQFDGVDDHIDVGYLNFTSALTIEAWIKPTSSAQRIVSKWGTTGESRSYLLAAYYSSNKFTFTFAIYTTTDWAYGISESLISYTSSQWYHLIGVYNGTDTKLYVNGREDYNQTYNPPDWVNIRSTPTLLRIGVEGDDGVSYPFNGTIDEIAIYNRSLTADEVADHYKRGVLRLNFTLRSCGNRDCINEDWQLACSNATSCNLSNLTDSRYIQYEALFQTDDSTQTPELQNVIINFSNGSDTTPPKVIIISPLNQTYNTTSMLFNITLNEEASLCLVSLNNWTTNYTMINTTSLNYNYTNSSMTDGTYTAKFWCNDTTGNINNTKQATFTKDTSPPYFINLSNQTSINREVFDYDIEAADALSSVNCFSVNDTTNFTINCSGYLRNNTNLSIGLYWLNITVNDTVGNRNSTVFYVNVTTDTTAPIVQLLSPADGYSTTSTSITFSYNVSDAATIANCSLIIGGSIDQTDTTITKNTTQEFSKTLSVGSYTWSVNCTDLSGNTGNSSTRTFAITSSDTGGTTSGGGGGGGYVTPPITKVEPVKPAEPVVGKEETIGEVKPGEIYTFEFTKPPTGGIPAGDIFAVLKDQPPVTSVSIDVKEGLKDVTVTVTKLEDKPVYASQPSAETYSFVNQYFEAKATTKVEEKEVSISEKIRESTITVFIEKKWLEENQATKASVKVLRLHNDEWQELDTKAVKQDAGFVYYEAKVSGLSLFTIVTKKIQPGSQVCDSFDKKCFENELRECSPYGTQWVKLEDCKFGCSVDRCKEQPAGALEQLGGFAIWIAVAVFVIFILVVFIFLKMR